MNVEDIEIIRSRRRTLALQVTSQGRVVARAPLRMPSSEIYAFARSKSAWIDRKVAGRRAQAAAAEPVLTKDERRALMEEARMVVPQRVRHFAGLVGVSCRSVMLRFQRTRWGSCSSTGNLSFNCLLMMAPPEVLDYVVVHELCHRREMNHSPRFWAEVERVCPEWRVRRRWLREQGAALLRRL